MEVLGPGFWFILHMTPIDVRGKNYGEDEQMSIMNSLLNLIQCVMPCSECKAHMTKFMIRNSVFANPNLSQWVSVFHREVNTRLGKKTMSYMGEFAWMQACIACTWSQEDGRRQAIRMWAGIRFLLASILTFPLQMSLPSRVDMLLTILSVCKFSFPDVESRESLAAAASRISEVGKRKDSDDSEHLHGVLVQLDNAVRRCLGVDKNGDNTKSLGDMTVLDAAAYEASLVAMKGAMSVETTKSKKRTRKDGAASSALSSDSVDMVLDSIGTHASSSGRTMDDELEAGFFGGNVEEMGDNVNLNMWIPSDPQIKPFYVKESIGKVNPWGESQEGDASNDPVPLPARPKRIVLRARSNLVPRHYRPGGGI